MSFERGDKIELINPGQTLPGLPDDMDSFIVIAPELGNPGFVWIEGVPTSVDGTLFRLVPNSTVYLTNTTGNHNKFYRVRWDGDLTVWCTWGPIGADGQTQEKVLETREQAARFRSEILERKRIGGYRDAPDPKG